MKSTKDSNCEFCAIVDGREHAQEVMRTSRVVAFFPLHPATLGHTLVVPVEHTSDIWALDDVTGRDLAEATLLVARAIRRAVPLDGLNVIQSNGEAATQTVPHVHVHIVPRVFGDAIADFWPREVAFSEPEIVNAWTAIKGSVEAISSIGQSDGPAEM